MSKKIYLDYQATTPVDPQILKKMMPYFNENFGNPHSNNHDYGRKAAEAVEEARKKAEMETEVALQSINAEKEKAVKEIKTAAVDLSIKAASKLIEKNLDSSDNRKLVTDTIDKVGQA